MNFLHDLLFLTDVMQHLQSLNLSLQGKEKYMYSDCYQFSKKHFQRGLKTFYCFPQIKKKIISNSSIQYDNNKLNYLGKNYRIYWKIFKTGLKICMQLNHL